MSLTLGYFIQAQWYEPLHGHIAHIVEHAGKATVTGEHISYTCFAVGCPGWGTCRLVAIFLCVCVYQSQILVRALLQKVQYNRLLMKLVLIFSQWGKLPGKW